MTLRGKVILLTGATGGIGRPTTLLLAREGARVALVARSEGPLRALEAEVKALGGDVAGFPGDLRRAADCKRVVDEAVRHFGGLDAVVNNAGVSILREAEEATDAEIEELIEINLLATIRVTRAALPALAARRGSAIVNVASFAARVGAPNYSYYNASKFAVAGLTEGWRRELRHRGIRVTLYMPAAVETPLLDRAPRDRALGVGPAGVVLRPEEVAAAIVRALKWHPADVYTPFWNRWLAWLNLIAPAFSDRVLNALFRYPRKK
ncbi:MAG TPA: SDR family oxidoreductase [Candidatus Eisenbacteria bacterium]|nr:SDR family oxidoreductase [Candidatus Eisenbacteria bacterium]